MTDRALSPPGAGLSVLLTDLYQITMARGYLEAGVGGRPACFDLYFRTLPFGGGYAVAAGLEQVLTFLENFRFKNDDLEYLASLTAGDGERLFPDTFLEYLRNLHLQVTVEAVPEGTVVFPFQPLAKVTGPILQCQLIETPLLNIINFQTLIATKAARVCQAARGRPVLEFGLRRAQGVDGSLSAARAAFIGGCTGTSNVLAGKLFGIPVRGTHSHSWVLCFESELESFRRFAQTFPSAAVLLVDTYRTEDGVAHAVQIGIELRKQGYTLAGIRLDSGDLLALSRRARTMLDEAGLNDTRILASGDLDEFEIDRLLSAGAPIDAWGVGTRLVTAFGQPALGGVYKLCAIWRSRRWTDTVKTSEDPTKINLPGRHAVHRYFDSQRRPFADLLCDEEYPAGRGGDGRHPLFPDIHVHIPPGTPSEPLLTTVFSRGRPLIPLTPLPAIRKRALQQVAALPAEVRRLENPAPYPAVVEQSLLRRRDRAVQSRHICKG